MSGTLTLVGTPIGNLSDMSPRGVKALRECDFIAAEDTRVTMNLLNHFEIRKPLVSYYEHNKRQRGGEILSRLQAGESAVLVTDAGMPAISDPGEELVALCHDEGIPVTVVPGPSAVVTALALSGLPAGRFTFEGFLSVNKRSRKEHLEAVAQEQRTMIFYEAPHKLRKTLSDFAKVFGPDRPIALCRELTKVHEEVWRTTLGEAAAHYRETEPRGEFVLVVAGAEEAPAPEASYTLEEAAQLAASLAAGGLSASEAAKEAAQTTGFKKGELYRLLLEQG